MKVLVLNPSFGDFFCRSQRWAARTRGRVQRPPDWLAYATAVLEQEGHQVKLLDAAADNLNLDQVRKITESMQPEIIVLDSTTPSIYSDIEYARKLKEVTGAKTIMVGPHATAMDEETLRISKGAVDFIARREYDYTVRDLVSSIRSFSRIEGISYLKNKKFVRNPDRPFIENLDELPFPAWHHINLKNYFDGLKLNPFLDVISGRGCPFRCTFCLWPQVMHGRGYRLRSPKNVVDEMEFDVQRYPIKELFFEDDTFTANRKRANDICDEILNRKLKIAWSVNCRCDTGDLELFKNMKQAGCRELLIGPESGCQTILDNVKKGITVEGIRKFVKIAKESGLQVHACYVFGLPGETHETIETTIKFMKDLDTDSIQASAAVPFPGTELYDWAVEGGYLKAEKWSDWLDEGEQSPVVDYPDLKQKEIVDSVDRALKEYYFRPGKITQLLFTSKNPADIVRLTKGAINLIQYMWKKKSKDNPQ